MPTDFTNVEIVNLSGVGQTKQIVNTAINVGTVGPQSTAAPGSYTYLSDAPNIASVTSGGLITGVGLGTAWITVFNNYGGGDSNSPLDQASKYVAPEPIGYVKVNVQSLPVGITILPN